MTNALVWLLLFYAVLKLGSIVRASKPGFRRRDISWRDRILAREPAIFLIALALSVPLSLSVDWYSHRALAGNYEHSTSCYGQIMASRDLPLFRDHVDTYTVYDRVQAYKAMALKMGSELKVAPDEVTGTLAAKVSYFADRYIDLQGRGRQQEMLEQVATARHCLLPPGMAPGT